MIYTLSNNKGKEVKFECTYADSLPSGYGHRKVTVQIQCGDEVKKFQDVTTDMEGYDNASQLSGQEKYDALYNLIAHKIDEEVFDWLMYDLEVLGD